MDFFGMGFGEIVLILIVALLVVGPGKLVEVARSLGKMSRNLKKMSSDFTSAVTKEVDIQGTSPDKPHLKPQDAHGAPPPAIPPGTDTPKPADTPGDQTAERP